MGPEEEENSPPASEGIINPLAVWLIASLVFWWPLYGMVPKFKEVFRSLTQQLPGPTIAVLNLSEFCQTVPGMTASVFVFALPIILFLRTEKKCPYRIFFDTAGWLVFAWLLFLIVALSLPLSGSLHSMNTSPR